MSRVIVFLDYWNFQIAWNQRARKLPNGAPSACNFLALPSEAVALAEGAFGAIDRTPLQLVETRIYSSHDPDNPKDLANRAWMKHLMGDREDFIISNTPRIARLHTIRCRTCGHEQMSCPSCLTTYKRSSEKSVDAALIVDLLSLAWDKAYDVALIISSDHDFIPPIAALQSRGILVVNGRWNGQGTRLADSCDASIRLNALLPFLTRTR